MPGEPRRHDPCGGGANWEGGPRYALFSASHCGPWRPPEGQSQQKPIWVGGCPRDDSCQGAAGEICPRPPRNWGPSTCSLLGALSGSLLPLGISVHMPWVSFLGPECPVRPWHPLSGGGPETRLATGARSDSPSPSVAQRWGLPAASACRGGQVQRAGFYLGWAGLGPSGAGGRRFWEPVNQDPDWSDCLAGPCGTLGRDKGSGPFPWRGKSRPAVNRGWPSSLWSEPPQSHPPGRFRAAGR